MRNVELEEGEAYYLQDDDDDENIDPDRDFSYIDRKLENLLGQYQKEFLRGYSAECLGPRYGGYGSFLPVYERSLPPLPNQRSQNYVIAKSPANLASVRLPENPIVTGSTSLPARSLPVSIDKTGKFALESGISTVNNEIKVNKSAEGASNHQQQPKKPIMHHSDQKSLKLRVKVASQNVSTHDNSAIYSGLGLTMSPTSSPEGTPLDIDGTSPEQMKQESPSFIIETMTSIPLPNEALISPLHDGLVYLTEVENTLESGLPGNGQAQPLKIILESAYLDGKKEASEDRKTNFQDTRKKSNSKQKEASKEPKWLQNATIQKPAGKEDEEFPVNSNDFGASRREETGTLFGKNIVSNTSNNVVDICSKDSGRLSDSSRPSTVFGKKSVAGCLMEEMDNYMKPGQVGRHTVKHELSVASSDDAEVEEGKLSNLRIKSEKDKTLIAFSKIEPATNKRNELRHIADEGNKLLKQHVVVKGKGKEEMRDVVGPKDAAGYILESGKQEKTANDKEVGLVSSKGVNSKDHDIREEIKQYDTDSLASPIQKSHIKARPHLQSSNLEEQSPTLKKKKLKDCQTGNVSSTEPLRGSLVTSCGPESEVATRRNILSRNERGDIDLPMEMKINPREKGKEVSSRELVMAPSEREAQSSASKMKMQSSNKKADSTNFRPNKEGDMTDGNCPRVRFPVGGLPPPENASLVPLEMEDWVQCEKCQKWRLLPFGTNPDSLPKEWICGMLTWLPGMNKCSVSEDETTHALRALYQPSVLGPALQVQNNQHGHLGGTAYAQATAGVQNAGLPILATTADVMYSKAKMKDLTQSEIDAAGHSGTHDIHRPVKKDLQHSGGIRTPKSLKKRPLETAGGIKNAEGAARPLKIMKKRMPETEASPVPKKKKKGHQQCMENSGIVGLGPLPPEAKGESLNNEPGPFSTSQDFVPGSSKGLSLKVKNRGRSASTAMDDELTDVSEKKRKMKHHRQSINAAESFDNGQPLNNLVAGKNSGAERRKERKTNTSNTKARERSADKGHHRTKADGYKHSLGRTAGDNSQHKGSRVGNHTADPYCTDWVSRKTADARKCSERALVLGLSDHATTSSSFSTKVKAKACEVKCSPIGSISSSPLKVPKSGHGNGTNRTGSYNEPEELFSRKQLKSSAEGAFVSHDFVPHNEEIKDRKSNLSRTSGAISDAHNDLSSKKVSSRRHSSAHRIDPRTKLEDVECYDGKLGQRLNEAETLASQRNMENQMPNGVHFDGTSSERQKLHAPEMGGEKVDLVNVHCVSDHGKRGGLNSVSVDSGNGKLPGQVLDDRVNLRHPHHTAQVSKDIEASSSSKREGFHYAAKNALKEAKDLKHSANRLKTSGSELSTGIFFQAALKFLHGASLLEPANNENGRAGEMSPTEVYRSTAKLCEYCAREYEKCNDLASAALAYKCMEVAYLRVVYYNDVTANRDRMELQTAIRAAPQVDSPSSSASDIDNLNNQVGLEPVRDGHYAMDHRNHVISAGNLPKFVRVLSFVHDFNLAMEASRKSQSASAIANPILSQTGNEEAVSSVKRALDFSFHDVDGFLQLVRLAMESLNN